MPILINNPRLRYYYQRLLPILRDARASGYFMLILSLFSLSFFGAFAIRPTLTTIAHLQKQLSDSEEAYQKLQVKNKNLFILQTEYRKMEADFPVVYAALPQQIEAPTFLLKVRALATQNNLQITGLQIAKSPLSPELSSGATASISSIFSLTASGNYKNLNNFLIDLATFDRIATFDNIGITPGSTTESSDNLTLQLTGKIYTLFE